MSVRAGLFGLAMPVAALLACGAWVAAPWARGAPAGQEAVAIVEEAGVRLFGIDDPAAVVDHFRRHRIAVAAVDGVSRAVEGAPRSVDGRWPATLVYPSLNFGGEEGGSTVMYPHEAVIVTPPAAEAELAALALDRVLLVLEVRDGEDLTYEVVGVAARRPREGAEMDWFAGREPLLYRGGSR